MSGTYDTRIVKPGPLEPWSRVNQTSEKLMCPLVRRSPFALKSWKGGFPPRLSDLFVTREQYSNCSVLSKGAEVRVTQQCTVSRDIPPALYIWEASLARIDRVALPVAQARQGCHPTARFVRLPVHHTSDKGRLCVGLRCSPVTVWRR